MRPNKFLPTPITHAGVYYETLAAACRALDVDARFVRTYKNKNRCSTEQALIAILERKKRGGKVAPKQKPLIAEADVAAFDTENVVKFAAPAVQPSRDVIDLTQKAREEDEIRITISIRIPEMFKKLLSVA